MNYLQIAQAVKRESGLPGAITGVSTTVGEDVRIFNWVNWAARDISLAREDWRWRRGMATAASTTLQTNTAAASFGLTDFASWKGANSTYKPTAYRLSDGAAMEQALQWMTYDQFRMTFLVGAQTPGAAQYWSISPSEEFLLGPAPDSAHFIRADYVKDYTDLVADTDVPAMPARFHMMIVWRALLEYGGFDAASEVYQRAEQNYKLMWTSLVQNQLEAPSVMARSLA